MSTYTLVLFEVGGIQDYIFASNQLAQNIGASELVERSTTEWLVKVLDDVIGKAKHNATWDPEIGLVASLGKNGQTAEVIYASGGKALVLFKRDEQDAVACIRKLSKDVVKHARGLQFSAVKKSFDWQNELLTSVHSELRRQAFHRKLNLPASMPMPGLGITAPCVFTGLPSVGYNTDPNIVGEAAAKRMSDLPGEKQLISKEVADKLRTEASGKNRLKGIIGDEKLGEMLLVYDFDQFSEPGESSYIAVVHADVTGMGNRFLDLTKLFGTPKQNQDYLEALRKLSDETRQRAKKALAATAELLLHKIEKEKFKIPVRRGKSYFPFRPIIFGGDDVTFVTDGRLGLELATKYLQEFTGEPLVGKPVFARAGVAVVKTHFPFSRAYDLAETLSDTAKRSDATMLDWHFSTTGVIRSLKDIRDQDYVSRNGNSLLMRPVYISLPAASKEKWRTWENFTKAVDVFTHEPWAGKHNKLKDFQSALRGDDDQARLFCKNYRIQEKEMPELAGLPKVRESGWDGDACGYFDALEALDFMFHSQRNEVNS